MSKLDNFDVNTALQAVLNDDPELIAIKDSLAVSLTQLKNGQYAINPASIRKQGGLSQSQFAKAIGISVHTLKSWEQGQRQPSGSAKVLLSLLSKKPELISELATS